MGYIQSGKDEAATLTTGGERHGAEGYWITVSHDLHGARESSFDIQLCPAK